MRLITIRSWTYIGFPAKSGDIEKGAILKEKNVIKQAKELLISLIKEIEKEK